MTSDAAEVVRELAAAINGDDVQGLARLLDPEVVQYGTRGGVDQGRVIRGREAVLAYWDEIGETWEWQTFEPEQLIEADGVVVALWQETVRIRDSQSDIMRATCSSSRPSVMQSCGRCARSWKTESANVKTHSETATPASVSRSCWR